MLQYLRRSTRDEKEVLTWEDAHNHQLKPRAGLAPCRLATADVQLDHASISRQHAMLCFRPDGTAVLMDLDSAHGSFVGGDRLTKVLSAF